MATKNFKARIGIEAPLIAADNGTTALTLSGANVTGAADIAATSFTTNALTTHTAATTTKTSTAQFTLASTTRPSIKVILYIKDNVSGDEQLAEFLILSTSASAAVSNTVTIGSTLATFAVDTSSGSVRLLASPASTNSTTFTYVRDSLG